MIDPKKKSKNITAKFLEFWEGYQLNCKKNTKTNFKLNKKKCIKSKD